MKNWKKSALALFLASSMVFSGCSLFRVNPVPPTQVTPATPAQPASQTPGGGGTAPETWQPAELSANPKYKYDINDKNATEWQIAYKDLLDCFINDFNEDPDGSLLYSGSGYFLADIDDIYNTNIPEICVKHGTCEADYDLWIYTFDEKKKEVICLVDDYEIAAGHTSFAQGPNGDLYGYSGHMGYLWVTHYWDIANGVSSENIYEENLNEGEGSDDYSTLSEILGEETEFFTELELDNEAGLFWYPAFDAPTVKTPNECSDLFTRAENSEIDVYAVGYSKRFYTGKTGLVKIADLTAPGGSSKYRDVYYHKDCYCDTDVNFDGQDERLIRYYSDNDENMFILLSYQDGVVYAYVFDDLFVNDGDLYVCEYSVFHNWYVKSYDYYVGFVFDKDKCQELYSSTASYVTGNPKTAPANVWYYYYE